MTQDQSVLAERTTVITTLLKDLRRQDRENPTNAPPLRLFELKNNRGIYYVIYGKQVASRISLEIYRTPERVKCVKDSMGRDAYYVVVPPRYFEMVVKSALLSYRQNVELYQNRTVEESEKPDEWICSKKALAGNSKSMEDFFFTLDSSTSSSIITAFHYKSSQQNYTFGVAYIEPETKLLKYTTFTDTSRLMNFESLLIQIGARECITLSSNENERITSIIESCGASLTTRPRALFDTTSLEQDLSNLLSVPLSNFSQLFDPRNQVAQGCISCLIQYMQLTSEDSNHNSYTLESFDLASFMKLDTAAIRALNLLPSSTDPTIDSCLYGLLNKCLTKMGARVLLRWIQQPLLDVTEIEKRYDLVEIGCFADEMRDTIRTQGFQRIPDLEKLTKKLASPKASLKDIVMLYYFVVHMPYFVDVLRTGMEEIEEDTMQAKKEFFQQFFVQPLKEMSGQFSGIAAMVEQTIDLKAVENHEYLINSRFSQELEEIAEARTELDQEIERERMAVVEDLNLNEKSVKLNYKESLGYYFRIPRKEEKVLRKKKARYPVLESRKDGVKFLTTSLRSLNESFSEYMKQYKTIQKTIVSKCVEITQTYLPLVDQCQRLLGVLDVIISLAHVSRNAPEPYIRPTLLEMGSGVLEMYQTRHPCLECQSHVSFIANDVIMRTKESKFQIITGPNTGGKSTYIRAVGVVVLMAQIGCFVPCSKATITVVDSILARVGAGDNQLRGISTFMAEMLEAGAILKSATKNSLLIIDELGRGTSTYDGFGLAWSISHYISTQIDCFAMFASHFHELTALADQVPGVINKHVSAKTSENAITMLYQVKEGICDQSFGIHVAELAKFPKRVVHLSKSKAYELEANQGKKEDAMEEEQEELISEQHKKKLDQVKEELCQLKLDELSDQQLLAQCRMIFNH